IGATGLTGGFGDEKKWGNWARIGAIIIVVFIVWSNIDASWYFRDIPIIGWLADPDVQAIGLILIIFGGIVGYITKEDPVDELARLRERHDKAATDDEKKYYANKIGKLEKKLGYSA
ncbi:hypothetical protein KY321_00885, partial [Candidatus Woesearchaeota archaeon]|nr:hypothetical protein [Candidatus Woesearchaeota archaeon]